MQISTDMPTARDTSKRLPIYVLTTRKVAYLLWHTRLNIHALVSEVREFLLCVNYFQLQATNSPSVCGALKSQECNHFLTGCLSPTESRILVLTLKHRLSLPVIRKLFKKMSGDLSDRQRIFFGVFKFSINTHTFIFVKPITIFPFPLSPELSSSPFILRVPFSAHCAFLISFKIIWVFFLIYTLIK
jgi:hypothetical protein